MKRVSFQGERGAYSEAASISFFGNEVEIISCSTFADALTNTESGTSDYSVLPVENSLEGSVGESNDLLLSTDLNIIGEIYYRIHHCLIGTGSIEDVDTVYSHPQALGQCRQFIQENSLKTIPLDFTLLEESEMFERAKALNGLLQKRRTVRDYSNKPVPRKIIEQCLLAANSAPSGANRQPWHFALVNDAEKKKEIREGAEEEEREFYTSRAPQDWLDALAPLGTDANKPFLETAPYLIIIFGQKYDIDENGQKLKNYYVAESVGIATGLLIAALHNAGLATLTHTPAPVSYTHLRANETQR